MSSNLRNYFPVTGCNTTQQVFDRLPVQELEANHPYQWTLFILAFAFIKDTPIPFPGVVQPSLNVINSLMEIGAIHGKPYREWPGDRRTPKEAQGDFSYLDKKDTNPFPSRFGGYCHHAAITFPSWHRPYLMLLEQAIGEYAQNVAQQIENSHPGEVGRWVDAAKQLRFPYWDWADPEVDKEGFPTLFYTPELTVEGLGQKTVPVPNPLTGFTFPYIPRDFKDVPPDAVTAWFSKWTKTYRYTEASPNSTGSNVQALQAALKEAAVSCRTSVGMLFSFPDSGNLAVIYDEFSNTRNESRQDGEHDHTGSLEAAHNTMHGILGGNGHMAWPDYAAFDPVFYFHHCNVDRILALWEWCYPDPWMSDGYTIDGAEQKWTLKRGTYSSAYHQKVEDKGDFGDLTPFRHPDGTYWTSKETRFFTPNAYPKYYSYKEFLGVKVDKAPANLRERQEARARIAKYYNVNPHEALSDIHMPSWTHFTVPTLGDVKLPLSFQPIKNFRIFKVLVRLPEHAMGTSYHFNLYYKRELVGTVTVFAREDNSPCKACADRRTADSVVRGVITIPSRIINDIIVHSSIPHAEKTMEDTVSLVAHALTGKLVDLNGKAIATALGGASVTPVAAGQAAPRTIHPAEIALVSAAVAEHVNDAHVLPVHFFDWKRHGDLFPSGWKAELAAAPATAH